MLTGVLALFATPRISLSIPEGWVSRPQDPGWTWHMGHPLIPLAGVCTTSLASWNLSCRQDFGLPTSNLSADCGLR